MSNRYEIKQDGVVINTIIATEEFVNSNFPSEIYEVVQCYTASEVRAERNATLAATDYVGLADYPAKAGELEYRQALRDVPQQEGFPLDVVWPVKP